MTVLDDVDEWGPEKVVCVSDSRTGMRGVLVLDNTARGMGKGGTRMSPTVSVGEIARLARTMTWKWAAVDLYYGGAKAGLRGDPNAQNKEDQLRAFARALANEVPREYVFGLDMGLTERDAAIFAAELGDQGAAVGLPRALGGVPYDELGVTGYGVAEATQAATEHENFPLEHSRVLIQGFGAVGSAAAQRLSDLGATIVGISTTYGSLYDGDGLDVAKLLALRQEFGDRCVTEYGPTQEPDALLSQPADILIPAAQQDAINDENAAQIQARLVVEAANLPTTATALEVLRARDIQLVPDFIANAGGVIAAAFSMTNRYSPFELDTEPIFTTISSKLRANTHEVLQASEHSGATPRDAAFVLAKGRVRRAMELRQGIG